MGLFLVVMATVTITMVASAGLLGDRCTTMETYNAGLMSAVYETHGREHRVLEALKSSTSDFLCIQEVWMEKYASVITEGVRDVFPHHYSAIHESKDVLRGPSDEGWLNDRSCNVCESITVYAGLLTCGIINGCFSQVSSISIGVCITDKCKEFLKKSGLSDDCVTCVFMNSARDLASGVKQCVLPQSTHNRMNGPGLLVLSKHDMVNVSYTSYFPHNRIVLQRGYITAQLQNGITAVCTHFSANMDDHGYLEYDGFGSFKNQQAIEIKRILAVLEDTDAVLLGDMNSGPRVTHDKNPEENVEGDLSDNFNLLIEGGYRSPYAEEDGRCTFCVKNPLVQNSSNNLIDHILIKKDSPLAVSNIRRLYDDFEIPLSDHYGVGLKVCRKGKDVCEVESKDCVG